MCLAVPVQVVALHPGDVASVNCGGVEKRVSLALLDHVEIGDYVLLHVGFAINRLDADEAAETLALFGELAARAGLPWPEEENT